jgi:hypothetical protein
MPRAPIERCDPVDRSREGVPWAHLASTVRRAEVQNPHEIRDADATRLTSDHSTAEHIVQGVLVRAWRHRVVPVED